MAVYKLADRILEVATTTGTGTFTLANTVQVGFLRFADIPNIANGDLVPYCAFDDTASPVAWEVGIGTYNLTAKTLARTAITANSSGGTSALSFAAAPKVMLSESASAANGYATRYLTAGRYYAPGGPINPTVMSQRVMMTPFHVPNPITLTSLSIKLGGTVNSGTLRLGIATDDGGAPGTLLSQASLAVSSGNANSTVSLSMSQFVVPARYWLVSAINSAINANCYAGPAGSSLYGFQNLHEFSGNASASAAIDQSALGWSSTDSTSSSLPSTFTGLAQNAGSYNPPIIAAGF